MRRARALSAAVAVVEQVVPGALDGALGGHGRHPGHCRDALAPLGTLHALAVLATQLVAPQAVWAVRVATPKVGAAVGLTLTVRAAIVVMVQLVAGALGVAIL